MDIIDALLYYRALAKRSVGWPLYQSAMTGKYTCKCGADAWDKKLIKHVPPCPHAAAEQIYEEIMCWRRNKPSKEY